MEGRADDSLINRIVRALFPVEKVTTNAVSGVEEVRPVGGNRFTAVMMDKPALGLHFDSIIRVKTRTFFLTDRIVDGPSATQSLHLGDRPELGEVNETLSYRTARSVD